MGRLAVRTLAATLITTAALVAYPSGKALAGGPGVWTKIGVTDSGFSQAGLLRTADGKLHIVWTQANKNHTLTYRTTTISLAGKVVSTGTALSGWISLEDDPRLVPNGKGLRLVLLGNRTTSASDFFSRGAVYTETSGNGSAWSLVHGSMAAHTVLNLGLAATAEADGTPVAAFGLNNSLYYHVGVDPSAPAASADGLIQGPVGTGSENPALARDKNGSVWLAWFQLFGSHQGYFVSQILPTKSAQPAKAPQSGSGAQADNEPNQQVALTARAGGGVYMAYCSPTKSKQCAHIDLWKVGAAKPVIVPGSATGNAGRVALAGGPGGRLTIAWFDFGKNQIRVIRTNTAATRFGVLRTVKAPPKTIVFSGLQVEASSGRQDIIANTTLTTSPNPVVFWHTQVLPGLRLTASPRTFGHRSTATVTFTVTDAGQPVASARVSCLGKKGTTSSKGRVRLSFPRGEAVGKHVCTATKSAYAAGKVTIRVS